MVHTLAPALFLDSLFPAGIRRRRGRRWGGGCPRGGQREAEGDVNQRERRRVSPAPRALSSPQMRENTCRS